MEHKEDYELSDTMQGKFLPFTSLSSGLFQTVAPGVHSFTIQIVNIAIIETISGGFVLVDCGMPGSEETILSMLHEKFGENAKPEAILLTHGHFDHVGAIEQLVTQWNVPVYAHPLEMPYLTGQKNYPEPDGSVEGGLVAKLSPIFPNKGINISPYLKEIPANGEVPHLADWKWVHTPGHSEGHISFFRESDQTLIAGDAFVTVRQDSLYKVNIQKQEINGPPRYFTTDWKLAKQSAEKLADLSPKVALTGHGVPMSGEELSTGLQELVLHFDEKAIPNYGKYI